MIVNCLTRLLFAFFFLTLLFSIALSQTTTEQSQASANQTSTTPLETQTVTETPIHQQQEATPLIAPSLEQSNNQSVRLTAAQSTEQGTTSLSTQDGKSNPTIPSLSPSATPVSSSSTDDSDSNNMRIDTKVLSALKADSETLQQQQQHSPSTLTGSSSDVVDSGDAVEVPQSLESVAAVNSVADADEAAKISAVAVPAAQIQTQTQTQQPVKIANWLPEQATDRRPPLAVLLAIIIPACIITLITTVLLFRHYHAYRQAKLLEAKTVHLHSIETEMAKAQHDSDSGKITAGDVSDWTVCYDDIGRKYFINVKTGISTWCRPPGYKDYSDG